MRDTLPEQLAAGTTGRFWAVVDGIPRTPEMHGSIRRNDEGFWVAEIEGRLTADGGSKDEQTFPDSMVGVARGGTSLARNGTVATHRPALLRDDCHSR